MIQNAFEGRTDTLATWGLLQANCLLIKAEEEQERKAREESTLRRRLREAREAKKQAAAEASRKAGTDALIRRLPKAQKAKEEAAKDRAEKATRPPDYLQPVSPVTSPFSKTDERPEVIGTSSLELEKQPAAQKHARKPAKPCWLTVKGSGRHIRLPLDGELVLGRFDAAFGIPPDVDLAYEDGNNRTVSRRHARVVGSGGYHTIEDTGSRFGVLVNGTQIKPGAPQELSPGDRVAVGGIQMFYDEIPEYMTGGSRIGLARHILTITPTGRKVKIGPPDDILIGRSDPYVDFTPDVDLNQDGQSATRVSRRHAIIHWHNDQPYLEDLGSGFGTRVNGKLMLLGQATQLSPGDHIWLGGCVLAYDVEM